MAARPVLVVDDDDDIRESLCEALTEEGYEVVTAANGREALEAIEHMQGRPLILLDLLMPVMNGWEVLEALKNARSDVPVVVLSAAADAARVLESGAIGFLAKPVRLERLLTVIEQHSNRPAALGR